MKNRLSIGRKRVYAVVLVILSVLAVLLGGRFLQLHAADTWNYFYTGNVQIFTAPYSGSFQLEVWGAQGGDNHAGYGLGGYAKGEIDLTLGENLYICVGGQDGYNGGGSAYNGTGCGGGATHIAKNMDRGLLKNYSSNKTEVLIVAGGGGGGGSYDTAYSAGGSGGGDAGSESSYWENAVSGWAGQPGTQMVAGGDLNLEWNCSEVSHSVHKCAAAVGGSFGQGGPGVFVADCTGGSSGSSGGGGGGWYGGAGSAIEDGGNRGGAGGSGYTGGVLNASMSSGVQSGNGKVVITSLHAHSYTDTVTTTPTCTTPGVKTYSCSCGDAYTEDMPATGHSAPIEYSYAANNGMANGIRYKDCSSCSARLETDYLLKVTKESGISSVNFNGGSDSDLILNYVKSGTEVIVGAKTSTGYNFNKWTGYSSSVDKNVTITMPEQAVNLIATATAKDYTYSIVHKSETGVILGTGSQTHPYNTTHTVSAGSYSGYTSPANQNVAWNVAGENTITFIYKPITYTISINCNGGSGVSSMNYTTESTDITLGSPSRWGYAFTGWTGTGLSGATTAVTIQSGSVGNRSYTAQWAGIEHILTLNANGGFVESSSLILTYGSSTYGNLSGNLPKKAYHTFKGWYTAASGGTQVYDQTGKCVNEGVYWKTGVCQTTSDYMLYAHWESTKVGKEGSLHLTSNITKNTLTSGIKGYHYYVDYSASGTVTQSHTFTTSTSVKVTLDSTDKYLHIAAVDKAGNLGPTTTLLLGKLQDSDYETDESYPAAVGLHTEQLIIEETQNVYKKDAKTYYVKADGETVHKLVAEALMDGAAMKDYQINTLRLHVDGGGKNEWFDIKAPLGNISDYSVQYTDAELTIGECPAGMSLLEIKGTNAQRTHYMKRIDADQRITLTEAGGTLNVYPRAIAELRENAYYSNESEDKNHNLILIPDGTAPVITGVAELTAAGIMDMTSGSRTFTIKAEEYGSGLKSLMVEVTNMDTGSTRIYMDGPGTVENAVGETYDGTKDGSIDIVVSKADKLFLGDFKVQATAIDNVMNSSSEGDTGLAFTLEASIARTRVPHDAAFKGGDGGRITVTTGGYATRYTIQFPDELLALNPDLNYTETYDTLSLYQERTYQFSVPLKAPSKNYSIIVTAWKGSRMLTTTISLPVEVNGVVYDEVRTSIKDNGEDVN